MSATRQQAEHEPIARVLPMLSVPHLDREFDYLVSSEQSDDAQPGVRVRVRFHGRLVDAFVLERRSDTDHVGKLGWLDRVVSAEPVLTPDVRRLADAVAARYAGSRADVLRLAVPPRHANVEKQTPPESPPFTPAPVDTTPWAAYGRGEQYVAALGEGRAARAVWQALPGERWTDRLAEAAAVTANSGRGALVIVPDQRDVDAMHAAAIRFVEESRVVALSAGLGPAQRYRRWLSVLRGSARIVIGTRSAVFAPVANLGLVMVWDDGDDTLAEPRAPYPHAREVAMLRAHQLRCASLIGGYARTAEAQALVRSRWAHDLVAPRQAVRTRSPRVVALEDSGFAQERDPASRTARLPSMALQAARTALESGSPVLVQVPRRGYVPALACGRCRTIARCRHCTGPLSLPERDTAGAVCRWCGRHEPALRCTRCGSDAVRAVVVGARRTAEELGRAFPGTTIVTSGGDSMVAAVPAEPAVVVATPGAEPAAAGGYGAALLLDTLGVARPPRPSRLRGRLASLDGGRRARPLPRRRRGGRGGRRVGDPNCAGDDPLGPRRPRRSRTRFPRRGRAATGGAHGGGRRRHRGGARSARHRRAARLRRGARTRRPAARRTSTTRHPARNPRQSDAGAGAARRRTDARGRTADVPPGCSAPATINSRFVCKSTPYT